MLYEDNPFRVLGVTPLDSRREIVRRAEEKELFIDQQKCANARTILTNPQRRIAAEIHWFLECSDSEIEEIEDYISSRLEGKNSGDLLWEKYSDLTQLNIHMACMEAQNFESIPAAKYYVLGISRLFESIDIDSILQIINDCRSKAGFPEIGNKQEVESAFSDMRTEIRQALTRHLQRLPEASYTQIITLLSESYSGNKRYKGQAVLEDVISEYQIYIDDTLHTLGQNIIKTAKFIAMGAMKIDVEKAVSDLIDKLYSWDKMAQPLQLGALTKGSSHAESKEMLLSLRELALKLHNEFGMSKESLAITTATQEVFKELPEYADLLNDDNKILTKLIKEKEEKEETADSDLIRERETAERIRQGLSELEKSIQAVKAAPYLVYRSDRITALISKMTELDQLIKTGVDDPELRNQLRERIAYMVRALGIELHNTENDPDSALKVISAVRIEFGDMPQIAGAADHDISALEHRINSGKTEIPIKDKARPEKEKQKDAKKQKNTKRIVFFCLMGLLLLGIVIGLVVLDNAHVKSMSLSAANTTPQPTVKPTIAPTAKPTAKPESTPNLYLKPLPTPQPLEMPKNGKVFFCSTDDRPSSFKVANNSSSNYYMKFVKAGTNTKVITFFVRAYSTAVIEMPAGNLELKYAYGDAWYGETSLFGEKTLYAKDKEYYDFTNYTWEISFELSTDNGSTMHVKAIGADEF